MREANIITKGLLSKRVKKKFNQFKLRDEFYLSDCGFSSGLHFLMCMDSHLSP